MNGDCSIFSWQFHLNLHWQKNPFYYATHTAKISAWNLICKYFQDFTIFCKSFAGFFFAIRIRLLFLWFCAIYISLLRCRIIFWRRINARTCMIESYTIAIQIELYHSVSTSFHGVKNKINGKFYFEYSNIWIMQRNVCVCIFDNCGNSFKYSK